MHHRLSRSQARLRREKMFHTFRRLRSFRPRGSAERWKFFVMRFCCTRRLRPSSVHRAHPHLASSVASCADEISGGDTSPCCSPTDLRYRDVRSPLGIKPISPLKRYFLGHILSYWTVVRNLKNLPVRNRKLLCICHESVVFSSLHVGLHNLCSSFTFHPLRNDRSVFLPSLQ